MCKEICAEMAKISEVHPTFLRLRNNEGLGIPNLKLEQQVPLIKEQRLGKIHKQGKWCNHALSSTGESVSNSMRLQYCEHKL